MRCCLLLLCAVFADAQNVTVYSEFRRPGADGGVAVVDSGGVPREILSPAVARNGFASFHVVVTVPSGKPFALHVAQNPPDTVQPALYREVLEKGVPDRLEPVALPVEGKAAGGPLLFWLDCRVPASAKPKRLRLELQLNYDDRWIIYPMELRVQETQFPAIEASSAGLPDPMRPADAFAAGPWRAGLCGAAETPSQPAAPSIRAFIRRNAMQDVALARTRSAWPAAWKETWCGAGPDRQGLGPEWYLRLRGSLIRPE